MGGMAAAVTASMRTRQSPRLPCSLVAPWIVGLVTLAALLAAPKARSDGPTDPPDKGGTRPEAISLPTGPGSLKGLGESASAVPATGSLEVEVPVTLPPGPTAVMPDLALRYDSRQGNGPIGVGWSIALPQVQRRTDHGLPRYDGSDELLWNGRRLLQVSRGVWRLRVEGEFTRVVEQPNGLRADRADGTKLYLGEEAASQVQDAGRVFRWLVDRVVDTHGDEADYRYEQDQGQTYLDLIRYGRPGAPAAEVRLLYERRPDALPDARAGWLVTTAWRLASIETRVDGALVRRVSLAYVAGTGLSRLSRVQVCGGDGTTCLPPLTLTTTDVDVTAARPVEVVASGFSLEDPDTALVDVDGDSLPDVVRIRPSGASLWRNLGPAGFSAEQPFAGAPGVRLGDDGVAFQDMDGDGRADLFQNLGAAGGVAYFPPSGTGLGSAVQGPAPIGLVPGDQEVRWLDLDGDGRVDALRVATGGWTAWFNQGGGVFSGPTAAPPAAPWLTFADRQVRLADMNGDGLVDLVAVSPGGVQVFYSLGRGAFAPPVAMGGAPDLSSDPARFAVVDVNGDGLADLVYVSPGRVHVWLNQADGTFGPRIDVHGAPPYDPAATAVRFADLSGEGSQNIVLSGMVNGQGSLWRIDLTGGVRPNLLAAMDNGMGGRRTFGWRPTGDLMARAASAGQPWKTVIPFPFPVVTEIDQDSGRPPVAIVERDYRDPWYDGEDRQFRGFAESVARRPGDAHVAALTTDRTFHTGRGEDVCLAGEPSEERWIAADGALYRRVVHEVAAQTAAEGMNGEPSAFPAEGRRIDEHWEGTGTPARWQVRQRFDGFGRLTQRVEDGRVDGAGEAGVDPEAGTWSFSWIEDEGRWIIGLPSRQELDDAAGRRLSREERFYDGPAFAGLPLGQVERGDLTRESRWVEGDRSVDVARRQFDAYGNARVVLDGDGRRDERDYDPVRHLFPIEERRFPDGASVLHFSAQEDPMTGALTLFTDADGATTRYGYDALGRIVSIERPGDARGDPGERREYRLAAWPPARIDERRPAAGGAFTLQSAELYDGLLRPLARVEAAEDGRFAVTKLIDRDAAGGAAVQYEPFFAAALLDPTPPAGAPARETFSDGLGREIRRTWPAGGEERWAYGPDTVDHWDPVAATGHALALRHRLDGHGRILESERLAPAGAAVFRFQRDALGRLVRRVSAEGATTAAAYDGLSDLVELDDPDSGRTTWRFDGARHVVATTDARGQWISWTYDGVGRPAVEADGAGPRAQYQYDAPGGAACGAAAPGRLVSVVDRSGVTCFFYDGRGRLAGEEIVQAGLDLATGFAYDDADRLLDLAYPDGTVLSFQYGGRALPIAIPGLLSSASYDAAGRPLTRDFANGARIVISRDAGGRETDLAATSAAGPISALHYQLLDSGAPSRIVDDRGPTDYGLDPQERLVSEDGPDGQRLQGYDDEGRLTGRWSVPEDPRLPGQAPHYGEGAGPHALTSDAAGTYGYDAAGERTSGRGLALSFDAAGQLVGASGEDFAATYAYSFDRQRRSRQVRWAGGRQTSVLAFGPFVEVRDGALWKHVFVGAERIASLAGQLPGMGGGCETGAGGGAGALALLGLAGLGRKLARRAAGRTVTRKPATEVTCPSIAATPEPRSTSC